MYVIGIFDKIMITEVLTLRVPVQVKTNLENFGKYIHRSKSYIAQKAIEEYLARNSWQTSELKLAEEEIREGKFISNDVINEYLETWK